MKVYYLSRYCSNLEENVIEWFRNRTDAQKRRSDLLKSYSDFQPQQKDDFEWKLSQVHHKLVPETKDELIRWLNANSARG